MLKYSNLSLQISFVCPAKSANFCGCFDVVKHVCFFSSVKGHNPSLEIRTRHKIMSYM